GGRKIGHANAAGSGYRGAGLRARRDAVRIPAGRRSGRLLAHGFVTATLRSEAGSFAGTAGGLRVRAVGEALSGSGRAWVPPALRDDGSAAGGCSGAHGIGWDSH